MALFRVQNNKLIPIDSPEPIIQVTIGEELASFLTSNGNVFALGGEGYVNMQFYVLICLDRHRRWCGYMEFGNDRK